MSLLEVRNLKVHYPIRGGFWNRIVDVVKAVDGINFSIEQGQTYGLVGESGSGKSTTGKTIVGLERPTSGQIFYQGQEVQQNKLRNSVDYQRNVQMIFQDSLSSLNPQKRILDIIAEPLRNFQNLTADQEKLRVLQLLDIVGLSADSLYKYPRQFSGGQRQRIGIARAVATNPKLIIADEPVSALDLSVQAQILNFMKKIQRELNISYLFISHDLGVVRHMCQQIAIMHRGRLVEVGTRDDIYNHPQHIYTKRLLAAIPETNVNSRQEHRQKRLEVERIYNEQQAKYYDSNGAAFALQPVSMTHFVALAPTD
ncbi:ATP-binding cassette domain-containing protein [Bombilactobacillus thymidiniphilus]|uniref:ATP-binding cassette domain-containing protein n=1 Tax=Bombilactobacillus thymidiniphilus TaxID=2923363 RepID=A0ABY4PEY3_9LACO|nr:ATP-binding cassette domain-containing protein [Bombilactobacillus thymidiniphilus]UQS84311.1 ATP-binding cassette domain-containing protein [Bombilactobacillus thymidiniphilus]